MAKVVYGSTGDAKVLEMDWEFELGSIMAGSALRFEAHRNIDGRTPFKLIMLGVVLHRTVSPIKFSVARRVIERTTKAPT
jgi:hypothetical protein